MIASLFPNETPGIQTGDTGLAKWMNINRDSACLFLVVVELQRGILANKTEDTEIPLGSHYRFLDEKSTVPTSQITDHGTSPTDSTSRCMAFRNPYSKYRVIVNAKTIFQVSWYFEMHFEIRISNKQINIFLANYL
jgi:hypothetical protein